MIVLGSTPCARISVAAVCRGFWKRMVGSSAASNNARNCLVTFRGSRAVPIADLNTYPESVRALLRLTSALASYFVALSAQSVSLPGSQFLSTNNSSRRKGSVRS